MDSSSFFELVRQAFDGGTLRWNGSVVRNDTGRELALSKDGQAALLGELSRLAPDTRTLEEAALVQLLAFYLLDRGSLSRALHYTSLIDGGPDFMQPAEVSLEITRLCNLRCLHCYNDSGHRDAAELGDQEKLALVDYLGRWGVRRISITGGEPTLDRTFASLLSLGQEYNITIKVTTNGWELPAALLRAIEEGTVVHVNLSLDGADEATHDAFRGRHGSFSRVLRSMRTLTECRPRALQLNASIHNISVHQMEALAGLASDHGFDAVSFKPVTSSGRHDGRTDFLLSLADLRLFQAERARLGALYAGRLHVEGSILGGAVPEAALDRIGCNAADRSMLILSNGRMTPCAALHSDDWAPDIRSMSPMHAWLTHALFSDFRTMKGGAGRSHQGCPGSRFASSTYAQADPALRVLQ
jgi:MoaA/NifB/PqqE/SkfB family radical SAM enzyme